MELSSVAASRGIDIPVGGSPRLRLLCKQSLVLVGKFIVRTEERRRNDVGIWNEESATVWPFLKSLAAIGSKARLSSWMLFQILGILARNAARKESSVGCLLLNRATERSAGLLAEAIYG